MGLYKGYGPGILMVGGWFLGSDRVEFSGIKGFWDDG